MTAISVTKMYLVVCVGAAHSGVPLTDQHSWQIVECTSEIAGMRGDVGYGSASSRTIASGLTLEEIGQISMAIGAAR